MKLNGMSKYSFLDFESNAVFSTDRKYRYRLERTWNKDRKTIAFVMLNPSIADLNVNDPTVAKCIRYAIRWEYGTIIVGNIFALVSTNPSNLWTADDPIGHENDRYLKEISEEADITVVAWGNHGKYRNRSQDVLKFLKNPYYLMRNDSGEPAHPLYLPENVKPRPWED